MADKKEKFELEQLKAKCLVVWWKYIDDTRYYSEKEKKVKSIRNPEDSYMLINMFDGDNQKELWRLLTEEEKNRYKPEFSKYVLMDLWVWDEEDERTEESFYPWWF